jgi:hypothetical protein
MYSSCCVLVAILEAALENDMDGKKKEREREGYADQRQWARVGLITH